MGGRSGCKREEREFRFGKIDEGRELPNPFLRL